MSDIPKTSVVTSRKPQVVYGHHLLSFGHLSMHLYIIPTYCSGGRQLHRLCHYASGLWLQVRWKLLSQAALSLFFEF